MNVLVTAGSKHGATREIADAIAGALVERGVAASVISPEEVRTLEGYDAAVLGSAVYAGHWVEPAKALVQRFGDELATRPVWLFSSGPVGDPPKPAEDPVDIGEILKRTAAREHRVFGGRIVKRQLSFPERAIVVALRVPEGDFRDWAAVRGWAAEIAQALSQAN